MRKCVIFTIRGCFRSICNHPFLVSLLCVLIFMYRSSPFMFSLLVSTSPVLVCTAVLLGTLLFFGQPNVSEIEIEEKTTHEVVPIKTELSKDAIVEENESYYVERYGEKRRDEVDQPTVGSSLLENKLDEICREGSVDVAAPLDKERSRETESENGEVLEANTESDDKIGKQKTEWNDERFSDGEVMENHYASFPKVNDLESEYEKSEAESFDSEMVNADSLESPSRSAWKQVKQQEDEDEDDDALDSGSDQAESSSPDPSVADIIPMLDELHPLLDEEAAQLVQMSNVGSETASEQSPRSSISSIELVDNTENQEDSEVANDDNEDGEDDDDDAQVDKENQAKSVITWTEEDQKNLMDVGSSEIKRNQRLESLILRRTRKNISVVPEINLIDLESSDFPYHIAHISTTRQNPFDLPHDSYNNSGLPPIPGSAPSILLPRKNPFDVPYESSEGKPNLMGDKFQEELKTSQSRESFFRRHESFTVGPSVFAPNRQDLKWRPYFFPEQMDLEESSYPPLQRQSSEMSDSKASSVPESESVSSVEDVEDQKLEQEDDPHGLEVSKREFSEEDAPYKPEVIFEMKHVSEHVGHGSQSSEEEECLELGSIEKRDIEVDDLKFQSHDVEDHYEEGTVAQPGYNSSSEAVEQRYSRSLNASSLSEVSKRVIIEIDGEGSLMLDGRNHSGTVEPDISRQTSDMNNSSTLVDDIPHKEPVYDSSPPAVRKKLSSSSFSSDVHEESNLGFPPELVKQTISESQEIEKNIPTDQQSRGDNNLGELQEVKHLPIPGRENPMLVRAPRVQDKLEVEHSIDKGEAMLHSIDKGETVLSPNFDDDYHKANEKLISTPSARESTSHFHDRLLYERDFEHLEEVQVPNTPVESCEKVRSIQNLHIPELHELDRDVSPSIKSPSLPDSISRPSKAFGESISHVDTLTIHEEADEIKKIDVELLSELDSVQDFSIRQQGSGSPELEKHVDSTGERLSSLHTHCAETSSTNAVEVNSVEVNKIEHEMHLENLRDEIDYTTSNYKQVDDGNSEKELKPNTDARSIEVKVEGGESSIREVSIVAAKKTYDEVKTPEDVRSTTSDKEKENSSKSSSSSSSDSEENKNVISVNRRFSTPF